MIPVKAGEAVGQVGQAKPLWKTYKKPWKITTVLWVNQP
jgi:hypothetical protein